MIYRRIVLTTIAAVLVAGCAKSPTDAVELRRATPGAAFDEAPLPPPPPTAAGGNLFGSGT